ncbi:hypothetical protein ACU4GD_00635 [Cupriavidus basilensis]
MGIAGDVRQHGQAALAAGLTSGTLAAAEGRVTLAGKPMPAWPRAWIEAGVARDAGGPPRGGRDRRPDRLGERRQRATRRAAFSRCGVIRRAAAQRFARELVARFDVRTAGIDMPARTMSGGNMQKLILGRALSVRGEGRVPLLVVASQPTWGLDIGAVAYVRARLLDAAQEARPCC